MSGVVELIRARQETERAKAAEAIVQAAAEKAAREKAFKPIMDMCEEVCNLPLRLLASSRFTGVYSLTEDEARELIRQGREGLL